MSVLRVTQKLHAENLQSQIIDFIDYFSQVTIEWE